MIYFISITLFIYIYLLIKDNLLVFLIVPRLIQLITMLLAYIYFDISGNISISLIYIIYVIFDALKISIIFDKNYLGSLSVLRLKKDNYNFEEKQFWFFFFISLIVLFLASGNNLNFFNPRKLYEFLIDQNRSGSIYWPIIALLVGQILTTYSYSIRNLILVSSLAYFLGSKGLFVTPIIFFMQYSYAFFKRKSLFLLPFIVLTLIIIISIYLDIISNMNILQFVNAYFDYTENIFIIKDNIPILPDPKYFLGYFTDFFPGINRLLKTVPGDLYANYFPFLYENGKAPGLLIFDTVLRVGLILYPIFIILEAILIKNLVRIFKNNNSKLSLRILLFTESIKASLMIFLLSTGFKNLRKLISRKYT